MQLGVTGQNGNGAENYTEGGARGEVARGSSTEGERIAAKTSSRWTNGTTARLSTCVVMTESVVEQI